MRPPNLSVHIPSGTRISEPVSTGVAVSRPNCVELRLSVFLIGNADDAEHHPDHEAHGERQRADDQHRQCMSLLAHETHPLAHPVRYASMVGGAPRRRHPPDEGLRARGRTMPVAAGIVRKNYRGQRIAGVCARSKQAVLGCDHGGLDARTHVELAQHVLHVDLDGRLGDAEVAPDLLVARRRARCRAGFPARAATAAPAATRARRGQARPAAPPRRDTPRRACRSSRRRRPTRRASRARSRRRARRPRSSSAGSRTRRRAARRRDPARPR